METQERIRWFKSGLYLCWIAILAIPAGIPLINWGMCLGGPRTVAGSIILLILGLCSTVGAVIGGGGVLQGIRAVKGPWRLGGALSICGAGIAILPGLIFLVTGYFSAAELLR
jgi:hypothetical protein